MVNKTWKIKSPQKERFYIYCSLPTFISIVTLATQMTVYNFIILYRHKIKKLYFICMTAEFCSCFSNDEIIILAFHHQFSISFEKRFAHMHLDLPWLRTEYWQQAITFKPLHKFKKKKNATTLHKQQGQKMQSAFVSECFSAYEETVDGVFSPVYLFLPLFLFLY